MLQQSRSGAGVLWILQWGLSPEYISLQRSDVDLAQSHNFCIGVSQVVVDRIKYSGCIPLVSCRNLCF